MRAINQKGQEIFAVDIAMIVLTAVTTIARFAVRFRYRQTIIGADWMCLMSLILFYGFCGAALNIVLGTPMFDINPGPGPIDRTGFLKSLYIAEILFTAVITSAKLSILWLYYTFFAIMKQRLIQITAVICVLWFFCATFVLVFQCHPIHAYWDQSDLDVEASCLSSPRVLLGYELTNLFLDVAILVIPVPIVWQLHLPLAKRVGAIGIFLLGAIVCIASIVRLDKIWNPPDVVKNFQLSDVMMWSALQLGFAIVCASLPPLSPLLPAISKPFSYIRSWGASFRSPSSTQSGGGGHKASWWHEFQPHLSIHIEDSRAGDSPQRSQSNCHRDRFDHGVENSGVSPRSFLRDPEAQSNQDRA